MFTGLVEHIGRVVAVRAAPGGAQLEIASELGLLVDGESVAVNGVCLTVIHSSLTSFAVDAAAETLKRTGIGKLRAGNEVHLERALRPQDRLGGHLVTGHVDGLARVLSQRPVGDAIEVRLQLPAQLAKFVAEKGSVTLDGISLTVNMVDGLDFSVMLVPFTRRHTLLESRRAGHELHIEVDILARYVARWLESQDRAATGGLTLEALARHGFAGNR